ncbi:hypothetical protein Hypma_014742 [Hypsizygus marmoreus]|uniref:Protein kinase domain-containing protein n=1 Tax=Hypsizygus marmoreus TaxID=39966 RepID=A0A369JGW8_HYPMA|nr:hypothetical protein Hypma_014742 [Hypsizygus marmoreus]
MEPIEVHDTRTPKERFWVQHQPFLLSRGYKLRPRYEPTWVSSSTESQIAEDDLVLLTPQAIDAVRMRDNYKVVIKRVSASTPEITIGTYMSSSPMASDPRNRSVPFLEVLYPPEDNSIAMVVMPMLYGFDLLPFRRVGEFSEAIHQFLQGLQFMHEHNIAHKDACRLNLMMDVSKVIPRGFHYGYFFTHDGTSIDFKWRDRWTVRPVSYYFIDFGLSHQYPTGLENILDDGLFGQDRTVPEMSLTVPYDPFKADVYQLGNAFLQVIAKYEGLEAFLNLGKAMTRANPGERLNASEALTMFRGIVATYRLSDLKRRIWPIKLPSQDRFYVKYCGKMSLVQ